MLKDRKINKWIHDRCKGKECTFVIIISSQNWYATEYCSVSALYTTRTRVKLIDFIVRFNVYVYTSL